MGDIGPRCGEPDRIVPNSDDFRDGSVDIDASVSILWTAWVWNTSLRVRIWLADICASARGDSGAVDESVSLSIEWTYESSESWCTARGDRPVRFDTLTSSRLVLPLLRPRSKLARP